MTKHVSTAVADGITFRWAGATDRGKVRAVNEDSLVARPGLFVVADGMGGHSAGDVASELAVQRLALLAEQIPVPVEHVAPAIAQLNSEIHEHADGADHVGMGTTLVAALLVSVGGESELVVLNVGDSRCYLFDDAGFRRVTHDHSLVQELVDAGAIDPSEAIRHPDRNVVTRAVGIEAEVSADFVPLTRATRQRLVLCSDGVSGPIDDGRLAELAGRSVTAEVAVDQIMAEVLAGPASDNATVIVVDVEWDTVEPGDDPEVTSPQNRLRTDDLDITAPRAEVARRVGPAREPGVISEVPRA
jgi:PPM family protein phosphatase